MVVLARPIQRTLFRGPFLRSRFHVLHPRFVARKVVHTFKLADIGEGITECEVIKWYVGSDMFRPAFLSFVGGELGSFLKRLIRQVCEGVNSGAVLRCAMRSSE
jgi:hypothetical protein